MIVIFDCKTNKIAKIIGTPQEDFKRLGAICSIDTPKEGGEWILGGYEKGSLVIYDTISGNRILHIFDAHTCPIISCKFWKKNKDNIISSDINGNLLIFKINKVNKII